MNETLHLLIDRKYKVYVVGEYERTTNFIGLMQLLHQYSDFFSGDRFEQVRDIKQWIKDGSIYIDANITLKIK